MIWYPYCSLLIVVLALLMNLGRGHRDCREHKCNGYGPSIRFPFYLIDSKSNYSGYPAGFGLSCRGEYERILELSALSSPLKLSVHEIDYQSQYVYVADPEGCLPTQFLKVKFNQSLIFPFQFEVGTSKVTFFNCSNGNSCPIRAVYPETFVVQNGLESCTKILDVVTTNICPYPLRLGWQKPNYTDGKNECFTSQTDNKLRSMILIAAGGIIGSILVVIALFHIYNYYKMKGQDQARVEKFLEDYRSQMPTRFSYSDIKKITSGFKDKLGEGAHGAVFKGKLSDKIIVAVKILSNTEGDGKEFINEVGTMGKIHHVNVVRLLGFCADGFHRALVYDFFPNGSLQNFISSPDNKHIFLGWEKLQQIAVGVAKGIEYLHQGCDQRILHFDINPHNVLLDDNFTPKISDFGLAKLCSKNRSTVSMTAVRGTLGYIAPEVFSRNFGNVSYKSDIYSYGMLLLEMVGGRKNTNTSQETFQVLYPKWIHNLLEGGGDIRIHIENERDIATAKKLAIVGLWCIQWHPANRPSMRTMLQMLEGEEGKLKFPPNPFDSTGSTSTSGIIPARHMELELEVIHELE